jgi:hypothetical protein
MPEAEAVSQQQVPIMEARRSESGILAMASNLKPKVPSGFSSATEDSLAIHDTCDVSSFSLGLIPKQIADCFAGFKSPNLRPALPHENQGESYISSKNKIIY